MTDFEKKIEEFVVDLYKIQGVKFGKYVLKSGITSPVYFDLRGIVSHPKLMVKLSELLTELMENKNVKPDTLCGVPYTALPIATLVSAATSIPMVVRRKEKKAYGTAKMVEGEFKSGASCVIIEDVISTGSSVLETRKDLEDVGLHVSNAVVVLDREHGALDRLERNGIHTHVLLPLSQLLAILYCRGYITQQVVGDVKKFVAESQVTEEGVITINGGLVNPRLKMPFHVRAEKTTHSLTKHLFKIMEEKESLLCVAIDVKTSAELVAIAEEVAPYAAVVKTHVDAIADFTTETAGILMLLAYKNKFVLLEDRKIADIGNTARLQFGVIAEWAEAATAFGIVGPSMLDGMRKEAFSKPGAKLLPRGVFLVAELSSAGNLIGPDYAKETVKMAEEASDLVVGVVCQSPDLVTSPALLQLTPGIRRSETGDGLGQQYVDCHTAVCLKGADLAVVGRGITESPNRREAANLYRQELWAAYLERIG